MMLVMQMALPLSLGSEALRRRYQTAQGPAFPLPCPGACREEAGLPRRPCLDRLCASESGWAALSAISASLAALLAFILCELPRCTQWPQASF